MKQGIRLIAQCYDTESGEIIEENLLRDEQLSKANTLEKLGYLHIEQIELLQNIQDFKIKYQIILNQSTTCPNCHLKTKKAGSFKSKFHAALTDHTVMVQRTSCKCGWFSPSSIEGIYGSSMHPDLLKKQSLQGSKESYEKSSKTLNAESAAKRSVNSHSQIFKSVNRVGEALEAIKSSSDYGKGAKAVDKLNINIDGGHIKARGDNRSFEAMVATVHHPDNLKSVNKSHNIIELKTAVASAKNDEQETMKKLFKSACKKQGMTEKTTVTCFADGAENCWSIAHSIDSDCREVTCILDWFHIGMKFKNIKIPEEHADLYDKVKWHLWHGKSNTALIRLAQLKALIVDSPTLTKLNKLETYIRNNEEGIVNYGARKRLGLAYTSNYAESTVNTLINDRQKGKQKMLWGRDGAHNVLQIRTSVFSNSWDEDWKAVQDMLYREAA